MTTMEMESTAPFSTTQAGAEDGIDRSISGATIHSYVSGPTAPIFAAGPCSSSMDVAWKLVKDTMFPDWASLLVERQWAGRGQQRRVWHSPPGNIYASLRLPLTVPPWHTLLSLLLGGMVLEFLEELGLDAELKWPNDLLVQRKKVGGILIEKKSEIVIAGIGLNIASAPCLSDQDLSHSMPAACLREFGIASSPATLWIRFIEKGIPWFQRITAQSSPDEFIASIEGRLAFAGERISVRGDGTDYPAVVAGIDTTGGLRIKTSEGMRVIHSASIYPATV